VIGGLLVAVIAALLHQFGRTTSRDCCGVGQGSAGDGTPAETAWTSRRFARQLGSAQSRCATTCATHRERDAVNAADRDRGTGGSCDQHMARGAGIVLPGFLTAMLVGVAITNVRVAIGANLDFQAIDRGGEVALQGKRRLSTFLTATPV
jgi:hypothetical protein